MPRSADDTHRPDHMVGALMSVAEDPAPGSVRSIRPPDAPRKALRRQPGGGGWCVTITAPPGDSQIKLAFQPSEPPQARRISPHRNAPGSLPIPVIVDGVTHPAA
jgi:hypothetical protein